MRCGFGAPSPWTPHSSSLLRRVSATGTRRRPTRRFVTYRRWDVVAVDYPFIEGLESKRRPAVVVSMEALRAEAGVYWLMMITTAKAGIRPGDIPVREAA